MGLAMCKCKQMLALEETRGRGEGLPGPNSYTPLDNSRYNKYYSVVKPGGGP